jgi:hypothetical protein
LSDDQKSWHLEVCEELKRRVEMKPHFMSRIITGDETWVYGYGNKAPVFTVAVTFTPHQESKTSLIKCENDADCFL